METLLEQIFDYAVITPFKNYSDLSERRKSMNTFVGEIDEIDEIDDEDFFGNKTLHSNIRFINSENKIGKFVILTHREPKKDTKFFYSGVENLGEKIQINFAYKHPSVNTNSLYTNKEETIKKHFINPFSEVNLIRLSRSIRIKGDRITIKIYRQEKKRDIFCRFYRKVTSVHSVTIDKNFNFITLSIKKTSNSNKKIFRKNSFKTFQQIITTNYGLFGKKTNLIPSHYDELTKDFDNIFNDEEFYDVVCRELGITRTDVTDRHNFFDSFIKKFVERKGIKVPNDYKDLLINFYPTQKFLKKNENKLIASILDYFGYKSKSTIKLFHLVPNIDISFFILVCSLIGNDYSKYIANLRLELFKLENKKERNSGKQKELHNKSFYREINNNNNLILEDKEKENLIHILNSIENINNVDAFIGEYIDHLMMIRKIRDYIPEFIIRSKTYSDFNTEHLELSKMMLEIRKGWVIEYEFNEKMVEDVETPIEVLKDKEKITLYPHILKREEEYAEEGAFMHHCVGTYADRQSSIIISLRTEDKSDRVTSEFLTQTGMRVQSRHFCNADPPEYFKIALELLCDKTNKYARYGMLNSLSKKKVRAKINGIEVKSEIPPPRTDIEFNRVWLGEQFFI